MGGAEPSLLLRLLASRRLPAKLATNLGFSLPEDPDDPEIPDSLENLDQPVDPDNLSPGRLEDYGEAVFKDLGSSDEEEEEVEDDEFSLKEDCARKSKETNSEVLMSMPLLDWL